MPGRLTLESMKFAPMTTTAEDRAALEVLNLRVRTLLPELYQDRSEEVQPVSMGSADLKFGADGQVAWEEMWGTFCDLAMTGGPPHKGSLLEPERMRKSVPNPKNMKRWSMKFAVA